MDAVYRFPIILQELRELEPGIRVEVVVTNGVSDLKRREADIAIRSFRPTEADFVAKKLGEEKIGLYGTKPYIDKISEDYEQVQILGFNQIDQVIELLSQYDWSLNASHFGLVTNYQPMQVALCQRHQGIIFMPEDVASVHTDFCKVPTLEAPLMVLPVWLVSPHELRNNRRVKFVYDFIAKRLSKRLK
jgi:DNA-binding transcriptional LysR family regulator